MMKLSQNHMIALAAGAGVGYMVYTRYGGLYGVGAGVGAHFAAMYALGVPMSEMGM